VLGARTLHGGFPRLARPPLIGPEVDRLTVGQRVGVGPMCGSCVKCEWCESGLEHLCPNVELTIFGGHHGAFATHVRVNHWRFAFPLPDEIKSEHAGPLMCAGATVFTPILQYGVRPVDRVAVVGVGGLGHLAVQFLAKWGCDVTAVSSSRDKEEQARDLGAKHSSPRVERTNCGRQSARLTSSSAQCLAICRGTNTSPPSSSCARPHQERRDYAQRLESCARSQGALRAGPGSAHV
jgi:D-arabinose 1-dehydrogenase-like Zn-dependent alcohol dehydrogenase